MLRSEAVEQIGPGNLDIPLGGKKKKNLELYFTLFIRICLRHFINLNLKAKIIKLEEENRKVFVKL